MAFQMFSTGNAVACGGLDNKCTVYPLSLDVDVASKKNTVATHTSYMSCCAFLKSGEFSRLKHKGVGGGPTFSFPLRWIVIRVKG